MSEAVKNNIKNLSAADKKLLFQKLMKKKQNTPKAQVATVKAGGLSHAQKRLWIFDSLSGDSNVYNIVSAFKLSGDFSIEGLQWSFAQLVNRHDIFRTRFIEKSDGEVISEVQPSVKVSVTLIDREENFAAIDAESLSDLLAQVSACSFSLQQLPLFELKAVRFTDGTTLLLVVMHHMIADGWSLGLIEQQISQYYQQWQTGDKTQAQRQPLQFDEFVSWEQQWSEDNGYQRQLDFWSNALDGSPAKSTLLPLNTPEKADFHSRTLAFSLSPETARLVRQFADASQSSMFMVLLAAYKIALFKFNGAKDIVVGTPVLNRKLTKFEQILGPAANTVAVRTQLSGSDSYGLVFESLRKNVVKALDNQNVPFDEVVAALKLAREGNHPPLFQTLFALHSVEQSDSQLHDAGLQHLFIERRYNEFDVGLEIFFQGEQDNTFSLTYRTGSFDAAYIQAFWQCYLGCIDSLVVSKDSLVSIVDKSWYAKSAAKEVEAFSAPAVLQDSVDALPDSFEFKSDLSQRVNSLSTDELTIWGQAAQQLAGQLDPQINTIAIDPQLPNTVIALLSLAAKVNGLSLNLLSQPSSVGSDTAVFCQVTWLRTQSRLAAKQCFVHAACPSETLANNSKAIRFWCVGYRVPIVVVNPADKQLMMPSCQWNIRNASGLSVPDDVPAQLWLKTATDEALPSGIMVRKTQAGLEVISLNRESFGIAGWSEKGWCESGLLREQLLTVQGIADAAVTIEKDQEGRNLSVCYLVVGSNIAPASLYKQVSSKLATIYPVDAYKFTTDLPVSASGRLMIERLTHIVAIDNQLMQQMVLAPKSLAFDYAEPDAIRLKVNETVKQVETQTAGSLALVHGEKLVHDSVVPCLSDLLMQAAKTEQGMGIVKDDGDIYEFSYAALLDSAKRMAVGLTHAGLTKGDKVLLQSRSLQAQSVTFWACQLNGLVPIMLDPVKITGLQCEGVEKLKSLYTANDVSLIVTDNLEVVDTLSLASGIKVKHNESLDGDTESFKPCVVQATSVCVLFATSGSTGAVKLVRQTHKNLYSHCISYNRYAQITDKDVFLNWMPFEHVGGVSFVHIRCIMLGARQVLCPTALITANPTRLLDLLSSQRVSVTWAPNFAFTMVAENVDIHQDNDWDFSALKHFFSGGEPVVNSTVRKFSLLFRQHQMSEYAVCPSFGMSETCSAATINDHYSPFDAQGAHICLGKPLPGLDIKIVDEQGATLAQGEEGELQIFGEMVTDGYHNNPEVTAQRVSSEGWLSTGDVGYILDDQLYICGRSNDVIIINGLNINGHDIEQALETLDDLMLGYTGACGVRRTGDDTDKLAVFFTPKDAEKLSDPDYLKQLKSQIKDLCLTKFQLPCDFCIALEAEAFPRTSIGKLQRSKLIEDFRLGLMDEYIVAPDEASNNALPAVLHQQVWRPVQRIVNNAKPLFTLVLVEQQANDWLVEQVCSTLDGLSTRFEQVTVTPEFSAEQWQAKAEDNFGKVRVIYLPGSASAHWTINEQTYDSLKALLALSNNDDAPISRVDVLTMGIVATEAQSQVINWQQSALMGLLASYNKESHNARFHLVNVCDSNCGANLTEVVGQGLPELILQVDKDQITCNNIENISASLAENAIDWQQNQGFVVITGGLGGVGVNMAEHILSNTSMNVLLLGRSDLKASPSKNSEFFKLTTLARANENHVQYQQCDVTDAQQLTDIMNRQSEQWSQEVACVLHLAGQAMMKPANETLYSDFVEVGQAKVVGALSLAKALKTHPKAKLICFGSVTGLLGNTGLGAYSAVNSQLAALCAELRTEGLDASCIHWSMFKASGMSADFVDTSQLQSMGYEVLEPLSAFNYLSMILQSQHTEVFVGLRETKANVNSKVRQSLAHNSLNIHGDSFEYLPQADSFGKSLAPLLVQSGSVAEVRMPTSATEKALAQVWSQLLNIDESTIESDSNFFDLGGNSLMATRLLFEVNKRLGLNFEGAMLFQFSKIDSLAQKIDEVLALKKLNDVKKNSQIKQKGFL